MSSDELFTADDLAAKIKDVTPDWVLRHARANNWPHVRFSAKNIRFTQAHIDAILAKYEHSADMAAPSGLPGQTAASKRMAS